MPTPIVFISYSWDSPEHSKWVLNLANQLVIRGVDVILDQYDLSVGNEMTHFMEKGISADKILVILTPKYKLKADKREKGVGYEYSMLSHLYYQGEPNKAKILPILREGESQSSAPTFMENRVYHDMRDDIKFDNKLFDLIKVILDEPLVRKPALGSLPDFSERQIPDLEKTILDFKSKEKFYKDKDEILQGGEAAVLFASEVTEIFKMISQSVDNYKNNFHFRLWMKISAISITVTSGNYTFHINKHQGIINGKFEQSLKTNFFEGPVGFDELAFSNPLPVNTRYLHELRFDLDANFTPVFVRSDNKNIRLKPYDVATMAVREIITNEIKLREKRMEEGM